MIELIAAAVIGAAFAAFSIYSLKEARQLNSEARELRDAAQRAALSAQLHAKAAGKYEPPSVVYQPPTTSTPSKEDRRALIAERANDPELKTKAAEIRQNLQKNSGLIAPNPLAQSDPVAFRKSQSPDTREIAQQIADIPNVSI